MAYKSNNSSPFYKGNSYLPKAGTRRENTAEQAIEVEKCMLDPIYFAEAYFKVVHQDADDGIIPLKLYPYQKAAITAFQQTNRLLMATARQVGKTTVATVLILWIALFNNNKNIALLADKEATATEVLDRIKLAYENLPDFLKGGVAEWNKGSVEFENGTKIFASATGSATIRGKSIFFLYIDEVAHVENWDDFAASVLPTVTAAKKSKIVLTSTPNGMNHFYDYYEISKNRLEPAKMGEFPLIEVPWWEVEGRDEEWKEKTLADMRYNYQKFAQEMEVEFLGSSGTLISGAALKVLQDRVKSIKPEFSDQKGLIIYKSPEKGRAYALIADVSRGKGLDYSAFHVFDVTDTPYQQVCTYHNNEINATDYASVIDRIGKHYNYAQVLIELNDNGGTVIEVLYLIHMYENILMTEGNGATGRQLTGGMGSTNGRVDKGIRTTTPVKSQGCALIKMIVEQQQLLINDKETVEELKTFSAKKQANPSSPLRYEAEQGKHDDLVMGLVLFGWVVNQPYFKELVDNNILDSLKETSDDDLEDHLILFGVVNGTNQAYVYDDGEVDPGFGSVSSTDFDRWMND